MDPTEDYFVTGSAEGNIKVMFHLAIRKRTFFLFIVDFFLLCHYMSFNVQEITSTGIVQMTNNNNFVKRELLPKKNHFPSFKGLESI